MLRTYLVCREKKERERETSKRHVGETHSVLITAILLFQRLSCYWGKTMSLRMLTNLRLADLRLTAAQQRCTGQNLPSDLYRREIGMQQARREVLNTRNNWPADSGGGTWNVLMFAHCVILIMSCPTVCLAYETGDIFWTAFSLC
jgi:hypothetical protein